MRWGGRVSLVKYCSPQQSSCLRVWQHPPPRPLHHYLSSHYQLPSSETSCTLYAFHGECGCTCRGLDLLCVWRAACQETRGNAEETGGHRSISLSILCNCGHLTLTIVCVCVCVCALVLLPRSQQRCRSSGTMVNPCRYTRTEYSQYNLLQFLSFSKRNVFFNHICWINEGSPKLSSSWWKNRLIQPTF